jgi:hypothetical protein
MGTDDDFDLGYEPLPSDEQLAHSLLVYLNVWMDPDRIAESEWSSFTDYGQNPLPQAFEGALRETITRLAKVDLPGESVTARLEDRPPRADGLFPVYFVDLSSVVEFLRQTLPVEVVSALIALAVQSLAGEVRKRLPGKKIPEESLELRFNPATLKLLCVNFAVHERQIDDPYTVRIESFNTRFEAGYSFSVDDSLPMGWQISVTFPTESCIFIVKSNAQVHELKIVRREGPDQVRNANLLVAGATKSMLEHKKSTTSAADEDSAECCQAKDVTEPE